MRPSKIRRRARRLADRIRTNATAAKMTVGEWRALPRKVRKTRAHRQRKRRRQPDAER